MSDRPIVLVLGAGASTEMTERPSSAHKFPLGFGLRDAVRSRLVSVGKAIPLAQELELAGFDRGVVHRLGELLTINSDSQIDSVVARHDARYPTDAPFEPLAAYMIARELSLFEQQVYLREAAELGRSLYGQIFHAIAQELVDLRVVTFNYDRSLDWYLYNCIRIDGGLSNGEALEVYKRRVRLAHVHGQISPVPFPEPGSYPYQPVEGWSEILRASKGIRLVRQEDEESDLLKRAQSLFDGASIVCFLGFAFDPDNVRKLGLDRFNGDLEVFASMYSTTSHHEQGRIGNLLRGATRRIHFGEQGRGCCASLDHFALLK